MPQQLNKKSKNQKDSSENDNVFQHFLIFTVTHICYKGTNVFWAGSSIFLLNSQAFTRAYSYN